MKLVAILVACLVAGASALHVKTLPCKGDVVSAAEIIFLDITPCTAEPCPLARGSTIEFTLSFQTGAAPASIAAMTTHLYGIIAGLKVPFPGFNQTDTCKGSGLTCPLAANTVYNFALPIYIDPKVTIDIQCVVEIRIVDNATGKDVLCNELQVRVVG